MCGRKDSEGNIGLQVGAQEGVEGVKKSRRGQKYQTGYSDPSYGVLWLVDGGEDEVKPCKEGSCGSDSKDGDEDAGEVDSDENESSSEKDEEGDSLNHGGFLFWEGVPCL